MLTLYQEVGVQVKSNTSTNRIDVTIPRANGSCDRSKDSKKPERHNKLATDEKSYADHYLSSASSIFYGRSHQYPRSFAWRVIAKQKVLAISSADFARNEKDREASNTLAFEFQDAISPRGVSVCDNNKSNDIHVFVLTQENEVFELRIRTDFLQDKKTIPTDLKAWCSAIRASSLSIDRAFCLHADNPNDIFVSFASGKVQHWKRDGSEAPWSHVNYDDKPWGSALFSIVSRRGQPDIDFEGAKLAYNTAHAMVRSGQYLFTACLNHTMRVWHLATGKLVDSRDLLDLAREQHEMLQLNPAEPGYIQFLEGANKNEQTLLTYSPIENSQIKLWRVRNTFEDDTDLFRLEDLVPNSNLSLPDPDPTGSTVWSLAGLKTIFDKHTKDWQLWVLWRNHNYHKVFTLNFSFADISNKWQNSWSTIATVNAKSQGPDFLPGDAQDVTSKWLDFLLFPNRYPDAILETALAQYATAMDATMSSTDRKKPLQERLSILIGSQVKLRRYDDSTDYERYAVDTDQQWRQFWRIVENLDEGRFAPLSLAVDSITGMVVVTMTKLTCVLREASNLDLLRLNEASEVGAISQAARSRWPYRKLAFTAQEAGPAATLLRAAQNFFDAFPPELASDFLHTLDDDLYTEMSTPAAERIVNIFNEIDLANAVPDEVEKDFLKDFADLGGVSAISDDIYNLLLKIITEHKISRSNRHHDKTEFGVHVTFSALLEEILVIRHAILSLLAVVIFVDETDHFDTARFFDELISRLRTQERNLWLATHYRKNADGKISILQDIFTNVLRPQSTDHHPLPNVLTQHIEENLHWISGENLAPLEEVPVHFQCNLIRHGDIQLASDFLKFQPSTPWSIYIKGRLALAQGSPHEASLHFQEAAQGLARGKALGKLTELSDHLLSDQEAESFYGGLPLYYQHIVNLFESAKAYTEASQIAQITLEALQNSKEPQPNFKQNILLRLFISELKTQHFDRASDILFQFTDPVLQRASATDLVDRMLDPSTALSDISGIVTQLQNLPISSHPNLANHIDAHIAALAKRQTTLPNSGGNGIDYLSILYALRLSKQDHRGAVAVLFDRLRLTQKSGRARSDPESKQLRNALLALINGLTCVNEDEAYLVIDANEDPRGTIKRGLKRLRNDEDDTKKMKRVVVTLADFRREYSRVLDRCSRIERGDFAFGEDEGDDSDDEVNTTVQVGRLNIQPAENDLFGRNGNGMDTS